MTLATFSLASMIFLLGLPPGAILQSKEAKPATTGTISGRITLDGKPAHGIIIALMAKNSSPQAPPLSKVNSDGEGRFRLLNIAAGTYVVRALAPGWISGDTQNFELGKSVTVDEGEAVNAVDISLRRGAVITGRVEEANHQPIIETYVELRRVDEQNQSMPVYLFNAFDNRTDD